MRLMISMSVSQARCLLKGAAGQPPRRVDVVLEEGGVGVVAFWVGSWMREEDGGVERVRLVASNAKRGRLWEIIVGEWGGAWVV